MLLQRYCGDLDCPLTAPLQLVSASSLETVAEARIAFPTPRAHFVPWEGRPTMMDASASNLAVPNGPAWAYLMTPDPSQLRLVGQLREPLSRLQSTIVIFQKNPQSKFERLR